MKNKIRLVMLLMIGLLLIIAFNVSPNFIFDITNPEKNLFAWNDSLYLNTSTFELFKKDSNDWKKLGNIIANNDQSIPNIYINEEGYVVIDNNVTKIKLEGLKGESGKDGKDGKDGETPIFSTSNDGKLTINGIKTSLRVKESEKVCEVVNDMDDDYEFSVGDEIKCGSEYFYVFSIYDDTVKLMTKYNLDTGKSYNVEENKYITEDKKTIKQDINSKGYTKEDKQYNGIISFSNTDYWYKNNQNKSFYIKDDVLDTYIYDSNSNIFNYLQNYKTYLKSLNLNIINTKIPDAEDLRVIGCNIDEKSCRYSLEDWIYDTSYWLGYGNKDEVNVLNSNGYIESVNYTDNKSYGIRPIIEIDKSNINYNKLIEINDKNTNCIFDGELVKGVEFTKNGYIYRYKETVKNFIDYEYGEIEFEDLNEDGWSVRAQEFYQNYHSSNICSTINGKPIVSTNYMFADSSAKSIDLSNFDTSKVTSMRGMFGYSSFENLDLSNLDTSNVTDMSSMFQGSRATTLNLSSFDTSNVTDMSSIFYGSNFTILDFSNLDTSKVEDMSYMFYNYVESEIDLTNLNTSKVTNMSNMFSKSNVSKIIGLDTSNVTDMSSMFENSKATTLDLSSFDTSNVTNMSYMFYKSQATTLDLSSFDTSNVTNMRYMFSSNQVTTLDLSSFDTSKVKNMDYMFYKSQATTLNLGSFDTSNVTDMSNMFSDSKATTLDLGSFDTSNVTDMSSMFYKSQATTLDLSSFDTSNVTNMYSMFSNSKATTGYARTQADADKFNSSSNKPAVLNFVVKE